MSARRPWAWPLVPVYAGAVALKEWLRRAGVLKPRRLNWPVVSVGSLSAGGAGKTPVVIALAKMLQARGWDVDVLSRGYGREGRGVEWVASQGDEAAARFGDEPVVIARETGLMVWVGRDRFEVGKAAEENTAGLRRSVHVLDDGFQHRQLARDFEVVLVTAEDLEDALLPAGNRREMWSSLRMADAVVVREEEIELVRERVWKLMREGAQMWLVRRKLSFPAPLFVFGAGLRPVAFCAIARPEGFAEMLTAAGCGVVETIAFEDHHAYSMADMDKVLGIARGLNATGFVTTEKDVVKLSRAMCERLEMLGPVTVVVLAAEFADADAVAHAIEAKVEARAA
jgi:tetraacyldisaccharide 4'-kinase